LRNTAARSKCYEARNGESEAEREADLAERLQAIDTATKRAQEKIGDKPLDVILCTDFNRHYVLWGGHRARRTAYRQNEGDQIVDYMQTARLHSLLPAGTITWEHQSGDLATTVDVILGSERIKDDLEYCRVYDNDYGSDHRPIALSFTGRNPEESPRKRKRLYKNADWEKIREVIGSQLGDGRHMKTITDTATFDRAAGILVNGINRVLEEHVSRAKESPYAKRWWSKELSILRTDFTVKRNRITTLRRRGEDTALEGIPRRPTKHLESSELRKTVRSCYRRTRTGCGSTKIPIRRGKSRDPYGHLLSYTSYARNVRR
jgi:hypothetical protein